MSCATVVRGLEASPQWYFVPEPVGSHKYVAMHAVPFVWPPWSYCLGPTHRLFCGTERYAEESLRELH